MSDQLIARLRKLTGATAGQDDANAINGDDRMHQMAMSNGRRPKKVIDAQRGNKTYRLVDFIHRPQLAKNEDRDWYERDTSLDLVHS